MSNLPSVTQVLGVLRREGLERWFKANTEEFCDAESKKGREVGKIIHSIIQANIEKMEIRIETEYDREVMFCLKGLAKFKKEHPELKFKKAEVEVVSEEHGFMGHLDCLAMEGKELVIFDWKSSKCDVGKISKSGLSKEKDIPPIYPEHLFQVSAYVAAYNEMNGYRETSGLRPPIEQAKIIVFAKDRAVYNYLTILRPALDRMFKEVFLPALSIYKYQQEEENANRHNKRLGSPQDSKGFGNRSNEGARLPADF